MNLCKWNDSLDVATVISYVLGWSFVSKETKWDARGCNGSVVLE